MRKNGLVESAVAGGAAAGTVVVSILRKGFVPVLLAGGDAAGSRGGGLEIGKLSLGGEGTL